VSKAAKHHMDSVSMGPVIASLAWAVWTAPNPYAQAIVLGMDFACKATVLVNLATTATTAP